MSEFEGKSGKWAWEIQKEQQAKVEELQKRIDKALKIHDEFDDQDDVRLMMYAVEQALKGGA
ncbi:TPA: hypothetical protein VAM28_003388 [Acinetobacter baumannii]|nr:hypothetical protein [Acinetobacter baumannii]HEO1767692.1 hypothetical protein [Acinetobacter baumannii]